MISGLHHYALEVPDLAVAEGFLQDFGLETGEKDGSLVAVCPGRDQEQVRLVQAPAKRLHHVTFTLHPGTMDAVRGALERSGTPVIEPPPGATEAGLWLRDPDGTAVQLLDEPQAPARSAAGVISIDPPARADTCPYAVTSPSRASTFAAPAISSRSATSGITVRCPFPDGRRHG